MTRRYVGAVDNNLYVVVAAMDESGLVKCDIICGAGGIPAYWVEIKTGVEAEKVTVGTYDVLAFPLSSC